MRFQELVEQRTKRIRELEADNEAKRDLVQKLEGRIEEPGAYQLDSQAMTTGTRTVDRLRQIPDQPSSRLSELEPANREKLLNIEKLNTKVVSLEARSKSMSNIEYQTIQRYQRQRTIYPGKFGSSNSVINS